MDPRTGSVVAFAPAVALLLSLVTPVCESHAQTATQVVRFQVAAVNQIAVTGSPSPLVINAAAAGNAPTSVTVSGGSYSVTTNEVNQKIAASIDAPMPAGVTLEVSLDAPDGATSVGSVALRTSSADVVTAMSATRASALPITYRLSATPAAQIAAATRTVRFTIVSGT